MDNSYVLDATMGWPPCFCPVETDGNGNITSIITGINHIGTPPGPVVAVVHDAGQDAVEAFCAEHATEIEELIAASRKQAAE